MRLLAMVWLFALAACGAPAPVVSAPDRTSAGPAPGAAPPPRAPRRAAAPPLWRVAQAGTTGCADAAALRQLRQAAVGAEALRSLATTRAAGGCVTVFPAQSWRLVERADQLVRLAPAEGGEGALWFWRDQVIEERPPG